MRLMRTGLVVGLIALVSPAQVGDVSRRQAPVQLTDFNGDGFADLAIGVPDEGEPVSAGAVNVLYGSGAGLSAASNQFWTQGTDGIEDDPESDDRLGTSLASGDFNGDGWDDVAVGASWEDVGSVTNAGGVLVIYGSAAGLAAEGNQFWTQDSPGVPSAAEANDFFGTAVASGDFNADGIADLAIGGSGEGLDGSGAAEQGEVTVLHGSSMGLTAIGRQRWSQDSPGIADIAESGDSFGSELTAGDFDGDGHEDLAIGSRLEDIGELIEVGAVNVLYGSPSGLTAVGNQFWSQDSPGVADRGEQRDRFGGAVSAGDFDADGFADLAIGVESEARVGGGVHALYGSGSGLSATGNQFWTQDTPEIDDEGEAGDGFGSDLAAADFDGDGHQDLAIGVPNEGVARNNDGAVAVIYGSPVGLTAEGDQRWSQDTPGIREQAEGDEWFGSAVAVGDYDRDGMSDLAVGVPNEDVVVLAEGAVHVIYGSETGLTATGNQFWTQDSPGIRDRAEVTDVFGSSLA